MRKVLIFFSFLFFSSAASGSDLTVFFKDAEAFLKKYVMNGSVAYARVKQSKEIELLYLKIERMNLTSASEAEKKAFYINSYNIIVIYYVAKHYPLKSPLDQSGFFDQVKHTVAGEPLTLNALEIKKLLATYEDARFHFALACAARSCPPLASFAFMPEVLDQQLTDRTSLAVNNPVWLRLDKKQKHVELSKIFDWYKKDFTKGGKTEIEWINQYRTEKIPAGFGVGFYEYDWRLNDQ